MNRLFAATMMALALAACREKDPADAPPVGHGVAMGHVASPVPAATATPTAVVAGAAATSRNLGLPERTDGYRRELALARGTLDTTWNACGLHDGDEQARCRDEAVVAYDVAIDAARAVWGDDLDAQAATTPGVLERQDDVAIAQVTGIRG